MNSNRIKRKRNSDKDQIDGKKLKPKEENDPQGSAAAVDGAEESNEADANDDPSPSIFKLNIDCCEELFEYLSLEDLHSLGQTCKKMNQYTGYFVRENYKSSEFRWMNGKLYLFYNGQDIVLNGFMEFVSYLHMDTLFLSNFARFAPNFKSINWLSLGIYNKLKDNRMEIMKEILKKCEKITINICVKYFKADLHEKVLKWCKNMRHLEVNSHDSKISKYDNDWLLHEYPNLSYLNFYSKAETEVSRDKLQRFFYLNKSVRRFRTNTLCLLDNQHWILNTDIHLDEISVNCTSTYSDTNKMSGCMNLLSKMFERGFYKHLTLSHILRLHFHC